MNHAPRILRVAAVGTGVVLVLAALLAAFLLFTTPGAKVALSVANGRGLPVRATSIEGALARRFVLRDVTLQRGPVEASVDTITIAWRPSALRKRFVDVEEVTVAGVRILVVDRLSDDSTRVATRADREPSGEKRWVFNAERVRVRRASIDAPGNVHLHDVDITASGGPDGYVAGVRASGSAWRIANLDVFVRASGNTRAASVDSLDAHVLGGLVRGDAFVRWEPGLSWRGRLRGDSLRVGELASQPEDWLGEISFNADGTGLFNADTTRVGIDLHSLHGTLRGRPLSARGRVDVDRGRIEASDASVRWGSAHAALSGSMADVADVRFDATIPSLGEILPRARGSASVRGRLAGPPDRIEVDVEASGRDVRAGRFDLPRLDATLDATLSADEYVPYSAEVRRADIRVGDGWLEARGKLSWRDRFEWDGTVAADRFETSLLTPARWNLYGPVSVQTSTSGRLRGKDLRGRIAIESLSGTLRDRVLSGAGGVVMEDGDAHISALHLEWGDARVDADGHIGDTLSVDFAVAVANLAALDSTWHGAVSVRGTVRGPRRYAGVIADLDADSLRVREYAVHRLEGHVDADLAFASPADVHVLALGASRGETTFDTVRVDVSGPRDQHEASVLVSRGVDRASLALRGALADSAWSGWLEDVRIHHGAAGDWHLAGRAPVLVSASRVEADSIAVVSGDARLSAHGNWQRGDTAHVDVHLRGLEMARFQEYLADGMEITGAVEGTAVITIDPKQGVDARVDIVPGPGAITFQGTKATYAGRATGRADSTGVVVNVELDMDHEGAQLLTVDADVSIPGFVLGHDSLGIQPIEGRIDINCTDIGPVFAVFAAAPAKASGTFTVHVEPKGTAGDFRLMGNAALDNARFDLASGLRLRDTKFSLVSDGEGLVTMNGTATSGGGRMTMEASSARSEKGWVNGLFTAKGERFQIVNQPDAQVFVSPELEVRIVERAVMATGNVFVPYARIELAQVPPSAASASSDVVFVEDSLATQRVLQMQTQVRVELGDSVHFSGFGLRGRLTGSLAVDNESGRPTRGTGEIQIVDGKYRAYGNELTIDPGRFVFGGGPIDNPGLDVRAYRGLTTQNVMTGSGEIVGVNLRGTLRRPDVTVFSNPPMSESEAMSYLVFGRPASTGSSDEQSALANAAMLIGMQQGTSIAGDIGKRLTLDDAYLEAGSDANETSFVAGKYLSPKLYVSYAAGLFENTNTFRTRYSLTNKWTLQTESGKASSTDLLYWFELGK